MVARTERPQGGYKDASFNVNTYSDAYLRAGEPQYETGTRVGP